MSHLIESMMYVGEKPWHGLGVPLTNPPTIAEALIASGLNWNAAKEPVFTQDGTKVPDTYAVVRDTDKAILGTVGERYHIVQNSEAFKVFQPMLDAGAITLETAGATKGGSRVWVLAKCKTEPIEIVPGDKVELYILFYHSHDGSLRINYGFTPIRTVCNNTLTLALNDSRSKLFKIKHTKGAIDAVNAVTEIMNVARGEFEATAEQYKALARKGCDLKQLENYVRIVFDLKAIDPSKPVDEQESKLVEKIKPLFEKGRGNDLPGVKNTMWAAYNAVTEYLTHERGKSAENRFDTLNFGQGKELNDKALQEALVLAA